ncbi:MAG: nickel insertion protein [Planctomycetota bacterium]
MREPSESSPARVVELVVNLDDTTGETIGYARRALLDAGALDVWSVPIDMKKDRPGTMLGVLAPAELRDTFARQVLELTGSFGVRYREWDRVVLERQIVEQGSRLGPVKLKVGTLAGRVLAVKPEFESVKQLASSAGVTFAQAQSAARAAADAYRAACEQARGANP